MESLPFPLILKESFGLFYALYVDADDNLWYIQIPRGYEILRDIEDYVARYMKSGLPRIYREPHTLTA